MFLSSSLCLAGAGLASLDFALGALVDEPMRAGVTEAAVPDDEGCV